jgi:cytochrome P450
MDPKTSDASARLGRDFIQDPYSLYLRLRASGPVHPVTIFHGERVWLVTRYSEAMSLLLDRRLSKSQPSIAARFTSAEAGPMTLPLFNNMLFSDPPDHTRLRRLVSATGAFSATAVAQWRSKIAWIADELLDGIAREAQNGPVDLVSTYAAELPVRVIGELLGVPARQRNEFRAHVAPMVTAIDASELATANAELTALLTRLIAQKRQKPSRDLLSALVAVSSRKDHLSHDELLAMVFLLISAGYETTVNLVGNGILALVQHPDQLRMLRDDPALIPTAVEEFLRYESPVNTATLRLTTTDITVGDTAIPENELVLIALSAANRDDRQFSAPDALNITRDARRHLAFGYGAHYCLGAPLARVEGEIAVARLLSRFDFITLDGDTPLRYRDSIMMRGLVDLPVHLSDRHFNSRHSA